METTESAIAPLRGTRLSIARRRWTDRLADLYRSAVDFSLALIALGALALSSFPNKVLFRDTFNYPDGLVTNEHAYWDPAHPSAVPSVNWDVTSGALFAINGTAWTGFVKDSESSSAVFRLVTKRRDFQDVEVSFRLLNQGLGSTPKTPPVDWDGIHVFLRYQSPYHLYYVSVNRRDNRIVAKKKVPGGPSNGGTYHELGPRGRYKVPYGAWQKVRVSAQNTEDGSVTLRLFIDDKLVLEAADDGVGGDPITQPGRVGIRGDNADLRFADFLVSALEE
jgi:hypothetical protein